MPCAAPCRYRAGRRRGRPSPPAGRWSAGPGRARGRWGHCRHRRCGSRVRPTGRPRACCWRTGCRCRCPGTADPGGRQVTHRPGEERPVIPDVTEDGRPDGDHLLGRLPVGREVGFAAKPVVVDPGRMRDGRVDVGRIGVLVRNDALPPRSRHGCTFPYGRALRTAQCRRASPAPPSSLALSVPAHPGYSRAPSGKRGPGRPARLRASGSPATAPRRSVFHLPVMSHSPQQHRKSPG